jgi:zinc protease
MKRMSALLRNAFGALALLVLILAHQPARAGVFNPEVFSLSNGMQVIVVENRRAPVVTHMVWYRVGAIDEPPGQSGIAHLLEHLMFKGTATRAPGEFSAIVARHGGQENAFTSHDFTAFFQNIARDRLGLMMALEADRMRGLRLTEDVVELEKKVVLEERLQRVDNEPAARLAEQVAAVQFFNSNYKRPVIGWEHEIRALTTEAVLTFYRTWYHPSNAILVVAGDVTPSEVRRLAEDTYGRLPPQAVPRPLDLGEPEQSVARRVVMQDERVRQPAWSRSYLAPSLLTPGREDAHALQVFAELLGGGPTSRLYRRLVVEQQIAVSAWASYDAMRRGPSRFLVGASPRPGVNAATLQTAVDEVIGAVLAGGVEETEIDRAKRRLLAEAVYARDSLTRGAQLFGEAAAIGAGVAAVEEWPEKIAAIARADVEKVARRVLVLERSVTAVLEPRPAAAAEASQ